MLKYTGHPLVDVGFATIAALARKNRIEDVEPEDLEKVAQFIEQEYTANPLKSFLTVAFTSNAWFIQHAYNPDAAGLSEEKRIEVRATRQRWADAHLKQWQKEGDSTQRCIFTGEPVITEVLSNSLLPGRFARAQMPLIQGDEAINFFPDGNAGLPISGIALLALQVFPLGCAKAGNGLLAVHSTDPQQTTGFAKIFVDQNLRAIAEAKASDDTKIAGSPRSPRTLLIQTLLEIETELQDVREYNAEDAFERFTSSITAYNLNNGKTPQLDMYELPYEITNFTMEARSAYPQAWNTLVHQAWEQAPARQKDASEFVPRRNYLYEDIFELPEKAPRFIRTYFLRLPKPGRYEQDPRTTYSLRNDYQLVYFDLLELFLRRILFMDDVRIKRIKVFGDKLAMYVRQNNGKRFFRIFAGEQNYYNFRQQLIKANEDFVRTGGEPLFGVDEYVDIFERQYDKHPPNWKLARDLVLIRLIEQLKDWLRNNTDALPERSAEESSQNSEEE